MSKSPKQPIDTKPKGNQTYKIKRDKLSKWIEPYYEDCPQSLIITLTEENDRLRKEIDQIKKINFAIKKEMDDLHARLIRERYINLYSDENEIPPNMDLENH